MKHLSSLRILILLTMIASFALCMQSCEDEETGTSEVTLLSFGPAGVKHGEKIKFIGTNLNRVTSIVLPSSIEIGNDGFASQSAGVIEIVVPEEAESGTVILKTPEGDIETKTSISFDVDVEISSIPAEAKPGTNITISGNKVNWIEEIIFEDAVPVTEFVSKSVDELVVTVPMTAQTGRLIFHTGGTDPLSIESETDLVVSLPQVTSISPTETTHASDLTVTGSNLDLVTSIVFPGEKTVSEFKSRSETELILTVPPGATKGKITLKQASPIDVVTEQELTIILPVGTALQPQPAVPGTDNITITGTNLELVKTLTLPGTEAPVDVVSEDFITHTATEIVFDLPLETRSGAVKYTTIHDYTNNLGVNLSIGDGPPPLDYYIYKDGLQNSWSEWGGWGHSAKDFASTEEVFSGTSAIKMTFTDQYGAMQIGSPSATVFSGYTTLSFRVYVPAAQNLIVQLNNDADKNLSVPQGWSLVEIPISELAGNDNVTEFRVKNNNANLPVTIYLDEIGLKN